MSKMDGTGQTYPTGWRDLPKEKRIQQITLTRTREGMIRELLRLADRPRKGYDSEYRLDNEEVAAIYDAVYEVLDDPTRRR